MKWNDIILYMLFWKNIVAGKNPPNNIYALIECPKNTKNKYELAKNANIILLDRVLHSSVIYPHDYGLIPGTFADDGDPLDILVLIDSPTHPMTLVETKPIGVLLMEDEKGLDEKILAVAVDDPHYRDIEDIVQLPEHYMLEISEFFRTYKNLEEPKYADVKEWKGRDHAHLIIENAIKNFQEKYPDEEQVFPE